MAQHVTSRPSHDLQATTHHSGVHTLNTNQIETHQISTVTIPFSYPCGVPGCDSSLPIIHTHLCSLKEDVCLHSQHTMVLSCRLTTGFLGHQHRRVQYWATKVGMLVTHTHTHTPTHTRQQYGSTREPCTFKACHSCQQNGLPLRLVEERLILGKHLVGEVLQLKVLRHPVCVEWSRSFSARQADKKMDTKNTILASDYTLSRMCTFPSIRRDSTLLEHFMSLSR